MRGQLIEVDQKMSVNAVRNRHPKSENYFRSLEVDFFYEGPDSLEEIAWRKGVELAELLRQLEKYTM